MSLRFSGFLLEFWRWILLIVLFLPSAAVVSLLLPSIDVWTVDDTDSVPDYFGVIAVVDSSKKSPEKFLQYIRLDGVSQFTDNNSRYSFSLPAGKGMIDLSTSDPYYKQEVYYEVVAIETGGKRVKINYVDDDYSMFFEYIWNKGQIYPLSVRQIGPFQSFIATILTIVAFIAVKKIYKHRIKKIPNGSPSSPLSRFLNFLCGK
ncbi:MAG: hypothetical protein HQL70_07725 [Magnetococcales bacterium]|nr:hypothetical protein [Magnetococcales bacterium]